MSGPVLLTVKEVARRLRVSASLVYQLVDPGKLACHRIGNRRGAIQIRPEDVDTYLRTCRSGVKSTELPRSPSQIAERVESSQYSGRLGSRSRRISI